MRADQTAPSAANQNRLLQSLRRVDRDRVLAKAKLIQLDANTILVGEEQSLRHVYFPVSCYFGVYSTAAASAPLAVSLIGSEGMLGSVVLLGAGRLPGTAIVVGAGTAWRISRKEFAAVVAERATVRLLSMRYLHHAIINIAQHAACSHFHSIESRLARWLLMIHDRVGCDQFVLTQQMLADMLGVRRVGVSLAATALQARNLIDYRRGVISLIDRNGLLASSCDCYGVGEAHYRKALGKSPA